MTTLELLGGLLLITILIKACEAFVDFVIVFVKYAIQKIRNNKNDRQ